MIKSVIWSSMLDYPGHVCTTIFFDKCNFKCEYCQNKEIYKMEEIDFEKQILPKLKQRKSFVKHIILSGGECTIDKDFQRIIDILQIEGFKIGIHTNGYRPESIKKNLEKISYVGMDIKNDLKKYDGICGVKIDIKKIEKSIELIVENIEEYEFRTTVYPKYVNKKECVNIAKYLSDQKAKEYVLQQYKKVEGVLAIPFSNEKMEAICEKCNEIIPTKLR